MKAAACGLLALIFSCTAGAAEKSADPVPRFVSLRADVVNLRTGPGVRYPIEWVYRRKGFPLEIIAQFDEWRQVRDWQGTQGWVEQRMVTAIRNVVVQNGPQVLRASADANAAPIAKLDAGVVAHLLECSGGWCKIEVHGGDDVSGWLAESNLWGVFSGEIVK